MSDNGFVIENGILRSYSGNSGIVTVPSSVTKIDDGAFKNNSSVTEIVFSGNSVTYIGTEAFRNCKKLEAVNLPDNLAQIKDRAFSSCPALSYVSIPSSVILIGDSIIDNPGTIILTEKGSEAEKFAAKNNLKVSFNAEDAKKGLSKKHDDIFVKEFNIFGETVSCSSCMAKYQSILAYYSALKDTIYQRFVDSLPLTLNGDISKLKDFAEYCRDKEKDVISRLEREGVFISSVAVSNAAFQHEKLIFDGILAIVELYKGTMEYHAETTAAQSRAIYQEAEDSITGLSYGIIGGPLDMMLYAYDEMRVKQQQRAEAYARAEQKIKIMKSNAQTALQKEYADVVTKSLDTYQKLINGYSDILMQTELAALANAGYIDAEAVDRIDIEKSSQLIKRAIDNPQADNGFYIAKALDMYPGNISAYVFAADNNYVSPELDELAQFMQLSDIVKTRIKESKRIRKGKLRTEIADSENANKAVSLLNSNIAMFSEYEQQYIVQEIADSITPKVEGIVDDVSVIVSKCSNTQDSESLLDLSTALCKERLSKVINEDSWNEIKKRSVKPVRSSVIPHEASNSYSGLVKWLSAQAIAKYDEHGNEYAKATKLLLEAKTPDNYEQAADAYVAIGHYKDSIRRAEIILSYVKEKSFLKSMGRLFVFGLVVAVIFILIGNVSEDAFFTIIGVVELCCVVAGIFVVKKESLPKYDKAKEDLESLISEISK